MGASSPWLPAQREINARTKFLWSSATESFCPFIAEGAPVSGCGGDAESAPYPFEGESRGSSALLELEAGVSSRLAIDASLTYLDLSYDDILLKRRTRGLADVRAGARYALARGSFPVAPYASLKIPVGEPPALPQALPPGEMQFDFEMGAHAGASLWPRPAFVVARAGYRWRARNDETGRDPGNETFAVLEAGIRAGRVLVKAGLDQLWGESTAVERDGRETHETGKRVTRASAGIVVDLTQRERAGIDAQVYAPLGGANYPTGAVFVVGLWARFRV